MKKLYPIHFLAVASLGIAFCSAVNAATPNVDAGSLLKQNEQEIKAANPPTKLESQKQKSPVTASPDEAKVFVRTFTFTGNTLLSSEILNKAVSAYVDRELTVKQIKEVADVVMNAYREAGWIANAFLPKQEIEDGVVNIQVVEAVLGAVNLIGTSPQRVGADRLTRMAESSLGKGKPVNAAQLDRTLLLLDDLPGVSVVGNLIQGQRDGEINLGITATDDNFVTGNASLDNQGSLATGVDRLSVNINVNSPARLGDALGINALKTQGSDYQRLNYSLPIGYNGWRAGLHASNLHYQVITAAFAALNPFGNATTRGLDLSYPLVRSQLQNVHFSLSYDDKNFDNSSNNVSTSYGIRVYNALINASIVDSWQGGGVTNASAGFTAGDKNTDSRYTKLNFSLSRLQSLNETFSIYLAATAQSSNKNLDSSEKMYLGGASGVRAYPSSEAGGSEGNTLTLELRQRLPNNLALTEFYDYGRVKVNRDNSIASPAIPNDYNLQGYGMTLAWQVKQSVDLKITVAQRIGSNPAANSSTGMDADGTKKITRIWLGSSIAF